MAVRQRRHSQGQHSGEGKGQSTSEGAPAMGAKDEAVRSEGDKHLPVTGMWDPVIYLLRLLSMGLPAPYFCSYFSAWNLP
jgi:hypothetical protein